MYNFGVTNLMVGCGSNDLGREPSQTDSSLTHASGKIVHPNAIHRSSFLLVEGS